MNTIHKITLIQFKNYDAASFEFVTPVTCVTGANGSGKTSLLDAIYYLCYTKSYFSSFQQHIVRHNSDGFRVEGWFAREGGKEEVVSCKWQQGKKELTANGTEYEKLTDHIGKYAAVMIAPDDMELINDGSEGRRKWMDSILGQTDKTYLESLLQYQRLLSQRNAWLKMHASYPPFDPAELEFYNSQMATHGSYIYEKRKAFIAHFLPLLNRFYHQLSGGKEQVDIRYGSDLHQRDLGAWLEDGLQQDLRMQRTLRGIHKDDLELIFNEVGLKQFGSQGQKKSYLFALKLAQYHYLSHTLGHLPILLLDDIFEKLDQERMKALLRIISGPDFGQVVLSDTHPERVREAFGEDASIRFIEL